MHTKILVSEQNASHCQFLNTQVPNPEDSSPSASSSLHLQQESSTLLMVPNPKSNPINSTPLTCTQPSNISHSHSALCSPISHMMLTESMDNEIDVSWSSCAIVDCSSEVVSSLWVTENQKDLAFFQDSLAVQQVEKIAIQSWNSSQLDDSYCKYFQVDLYGSQTDQNFCYIENPINVPLSLRLQNKLDLGFLQQKPIDHEEHKYFQNQIKKQENDTSHDSSSSLVLFDICQCDDQDCTNRGQRAQRNKKVGNFKPNQVSQDLSDWLEREVRKLNIHDYYQQPLHL